MIDKLKMWLLEYNARLLEKKVAADTATHKDYELLRRLDSIRERGTY